MEFKINNNGDSVKTMTEHYLNLSKAIEAMSKALNEMHPHGRNYQTCDSPTQSHARDVDALMVCHASLQNIRDLRDNYLECLAPQV